MRSSTNRETNAVTALAASAGATSNSSASESLSACNVIGGIL